MISLPIAAALGTAVLSTSFLSGILGMAGGMILMGILLVLLPLAPAMVLHGLTQMASNGWRAWLWRKQIRWRIVGYYVTGALAAAIAFAWLRYTPSTPLVLIILGLSPFVALALPKRLALDATRVTHAIGCGAISTVLQLLAGVAGPLLDTFFVRSGLDRKETVATKAALSVAGHLLKVVYFGQFLIGDRAELPLAAIAISLVLALVGTQLSRRVLEVVSDAQFRRWTRVVIAGTAGVYLVQGTIHFVPESRARHQVVSETAITAVDPAAASAAPDVEEPVTISTEPLEVAPMARE